MVNLITLGYVLQEVHVHIWLTNITLCIDVVIIYHQKCTCGDTKNTTSCDML